MLRGLRYFSIFSKKVKPPVVNPNIVRVKIDGKTIEVAPNSYLIEAIKKAGVNIPNMCYHPDVPTSGGICRLCLVEMENRPGVPIVSCRTPVSEGMSVLTTGTKIRQFRQVNAAMMFSSHPNSCLSCPANTRCKGQSLCFTMNIGNITKTYGIEKNATGIKDTSTPIFRDKDRCIGCDICVGICNNQGVRALALSNSDGHSIECFNTLKESECVQCGQCINRCPTGSLSERPEFEQVLEAIKDPSKQVVFHMAPSIRVGLAEEFGCKPGERILKEEVCTVLKQLGKNVTVFDTDFSADLTIMEEGSELIERLYRNITGNNLNGSDHMPIDLPMFTSCCPGWVIFMEKNYPDMLNHLSTCKSPMQMLGAVSKTYWAKEVKKCDPKDVVNVGVMPCSAKKSEADRKEMRDHDGNKYVDYGLTTRELGKLLRESGLDPTKADKTPFDKTMAESTGAGVIFGATGGVMEAALRTAYEIITGKPVPFSNLDIMPIRGMEGIREAAIPLINCKPEFKAFEGVTLKVAVAHTLEKAKQVVEIVREAKRNGKPTPWHFIEIMACPGGCIGGGGQPKPTDMETRLARTKLIYDEDKALKYRKSHENPEIIQIYQNFLKEPLGEKSHHLLHTHYHSTPIKFNTIEFHDHGIDKILDSYSNDKHNFLNIIVDESDRKGYISDEAVVKISKKLQIPPAQINANLSTYHYFYRDPKPNTQIYICKCHNCLMNDQMKNIKKLEDIMETKFNHGKATSKDGRLYAQTVNWLGWCVNDVPSWMVKKTGNNYIEVLEGIQEAKLPEEIKLGFPSLKLGSSSNMKVFTLSDVNKNDNSYSFINNKINLKEVCLKALSLGPDKIIKEIMDSNLVGRGGAGFKTGLKWQGAKSAQSDIKYVVCNADEGLPSTFKDWYILNQPERRMNVIAGMGIASKTIGAKTCYLYLRYEYRNLFKGLRASIDQFKKENPEFADINYKIIIGGGPYVAGEENAQFESIEGGACMPRKMRAYNVFPTQVGLFNKPTVINNVETLEAIPHIIEKGGKLFSKSGPPKLINVTGSVPKPVIIETHAGDLSVNDVIKLISARNINAAEVGGATEPIISSKKFDTKIGFGKGTLNAVGSIVLFDKSINLADIYENKLEFMYHESCKQCVPCRDGSRILLKNFADYRRKLAYPDEQLMDITADSISETSICAHGKAIGPLYKEAIGYLKTHMAN